MDAESLRARVASLVDRLGYTLWEVRAPRLPGRVVVTLHGAGIEDCARVSRALSRDPGVGPLLGEGTLEVSTPGVDRRLRTAAHFEMWRGKPVRVRVAGRGPVRGRLGEVNSTLAVRVEGGVLFVPLQLVEDARADGERA